MRNLRASLAVVVLLALGVALALMFSRRTDDGAAGVGEPEPARSEPEPRESVREDVASTPSASTRLLLFGRVLDADGLPFADLPIGAAAQGETAVAITNTLGVFEFPDCPIGSVELDLSLAFDPEEPLGARMLAASVDPLTLVVPGGAERHDVGTHVLPRSRPCWFEGFVQIDPDWSLEQNVGLQHARIEFEMPRPEELVGLNVPPAPVPGAPPDWRRPPWCRNLPLPRPSVESDGTFRFVVETPHDPILVRASVRRYEPVEYLLIPTPDGFMTQTFAFP